MTSEAYYTCKRCHRHIWVPESIIRGMGPICYGKLYAIRNLLKQGKTKEDIEKLTKDEMNELVKTELAKINEKKTKKKAKRNKSLIRMKKIKFENDGKQTNLDVFLLPSQNIKMIKKEV